MRIACILLIALAAYGDQPLSGLVRTLNKSDDPQFQTDVLKGMADGLKGAKGVKMPPGWEELSRRLGESGNPTVRELTRRLSVIFGSKEALEELRGTLLDSKVDENSRREALESLLAVKAPGMIEPLKTLLKDPTLRAHALRGFATYDDPTIADTILGAYPTLNTLEKKDALTTLASRVIFAKSLMGAVADKRVSAREVTADIVRLLRNLNDSTVNKLLKEVGIAAESGEDKAREISRYRGMVESSPPGDARPGRLVFTRACQQCHALFGEGGKVGPDLTGSDRSNLYYVLQNVIDPNALIPDDYRTSTLETKDDRVITGIVTKQDDAAVTILTANETLVIPKKDVQSLSRGEISMMPEALIQSLTDTEIRDLVAYLKSAKQVE